MYKNPTSIKKTRKDLFLIITVFLLVITHYKLTQNHTLYYHQEKFYLLRLQVI